MKIDGKKLADNLLARLKKEVSHLKKKKVVPTLAAIQIGDSKTSQSYVRQKIKTAKKIGLKLQTFTFSRNISFQKIAEKLKMLNEDPRVHGIIVQRPLPASISSMTLNQTVSLLKDVDGFIEKSPYDAPIAQAVFFVLQHIYQEEKIARVLKNKKILIIGRGQTAGTPIAKLLRKNKIRFLIAHSKTDSLSEFLQEADIIISCVGKKELTKPDFIKNGAILIGVGICREKGKLHGDYNDKEISKKASYYTPTPGGIGPLNVAFLMKNVVEAAKSRKI